MYLFLIARTFYVDLLVLYLRYVDFLDMFSQMISDQRLGRRLLSKTKAKDLSLKIQISFETSALSTGELPYQRLAQAYLRSYLTQSEDEA